MELYICNLKLGEMPLIAGTLIDTDIADLSNNLLNTADLIEFRIDMFKNTSAEHVEKVFNNFKNSFRKPVIATARDVREGGQKDIKDRLEIYRAVIPFSDILDVEIMSEGIIAEVRALCNNHKKILIGSYHNFESTPDDNFLGEIVSKGKSLGADIVKIAVMPKDKDDLIRLFNFTLTHKDKGIVTMSMGDKGLPSRVFTPIFGSLITYGYINHPSAPGQLSVSELMYIFRRLKLR